MYKNTGKKIKTLATVIAVLLMIIPVVLGIGSLLQANILLGVAILIIGPFLAWLSGLLLAGFGELVENTHEQLALLRKQRELPEGNKPLNFDHLVEFGVNNRKTDGGPMQVE